MKPVTKAHLALLFTNFAFAVNYNGVKYYILKGLAGPLGVNIIRTGGCVIIFWILYFFKKEKKKVQKRDMWKLMLCSLMAIAFNQVVFIKSLDFTSPFHASLLSLISPILIVIFAFFMLNERLTTAKVAGIFLAMAGAVLLLRGKEANPGENYIIGDTMVFLASIAYAIYFILVKPLMERYSPVLVTRWIFTFGFLFTFPVCLTEFTEIQFVSFSAFDWGLLVFIVLAGTVLGYLFNVYGLKILNASVAGAYIYTQPVLTGVISVLYLGEKVTVLKILATLLIFGGLFLVQFHHQRGQKKANLLSK